MTNAQFTTRSNLCDKLKCHVIKLKNNNNKYGTRDKQLVSGSRL